jgi:hypothetical protein
VGKKDGFLFKQAAHRAAHSDPKLKPFLERIARRKERKKGNQKAIVAVARKKNCL